MLSTFIATGCSDSSVSSNPKFESRTKEIVANPNQPIAAELNTTGEIVYKALEGGFYAFYADNGKHYTPMNLDKEYQRGGLRVRVRAKLRPDVRTFTMHGTPIEIIEIEVLGRTPPKDDKQ